MQKLNNNNNNNINLFSTQNYFKPQVLGSTFCQLLFQDNIPTKKKLKASCNPLLLYVILKVVGLKGNSINSVRDHDLMTTEGIRVTPSYNKMAFNNGPKILAAL